MRSGASTAWMSRSRRSRRAATTSSNSPAAISIPRVYRSFAELIADRELDVIDICTPPNLHAEMIVAAMQAGKHVICEKPFAGYFGRDGDRAADRQACAEGADV